MPNDYYNPAGTPALGADGASVDMRAEFAAIASGFAKFPSLSGNDGKVFRVATGGASAIADYPTIPRKDQSDPGFVFDRTQIGKRIFLTAGLSIPANVFNPGDWVELYNDTGVAKTLTPTGGLTLHLHGAAGTGARTLAIRGVTKLYFNSTTDAIVDGPDIT